MSLYRLGRFKPFLVPRAGLYRLYSRPSRPEKVPDIDVDYISRLVDRLGEDDVAEQFSSIGLDEVNPWPGPVSKAFSVSPPASSTQASSPPPLATDPPSPPIPKSSPKLSTREKRKMKDRILRERYSTDFDYQETVPPPRIVVTANSAEIAREITRMRAESPDGVFGFDLEWTPEFIRNKYDKDQHKTGLMQLCNAKTILLIELSRMRHKAFPRALRAFMEDPTCFKLGVYVIGDGRKLKTDYKVVSRGLVELNDLARAVEPGFDRQTPTATGYFNAASLQAICGSFLDRYLRKEENVRCSIWGAGRKMSPAQIEYASNDVYVSVKIYEELKARAAKNNVPLTLSLFEKRV